MGKHGGGFAMIGGNRSFGGGDWDQTVWNGLIPVDMTERGEPDSEFCVHSFKLDIPPEVMNHPIWKIVDDPQRNREILERMPPFFGSNLIDRVKPAATLLARSTGPWNRPISRGQGWPASRSRPPGRIPMRPDGSPACPVIFACQVSAAAGRSPCRPTRPGPGAIDFERHWGEGDNRYFRKFWRNVVYWLTENRGSNRRLQVETDKVFYRPGQPIEVTARAFDEKLAETDAYQSSRGSVLRPTASRRRSTSPRPALSRSSKTGSIEVNWRPRRKPRHARTPRLDGSSTHARRRRSRRRPRGARSSIPLQLIDDPLEFRDPRPDHAQLKNLARPPPVA